MLGNVLKSAAGSLIAIVLTASLALGVDSVVASQQTACHQVNVLRAAIETVLQHSEQALPRVPYYKHHPDQLAYAEAQYQIDLRELGPIAC